MPICLNIVLKQFYLNLQYFFVYFKSRIQNQITIKYNIDIPFPQKYYFLSFL